MNGNSKISCGCAYKSQPVYVECILQAYMPGNTFLLKILQEKGNTPCNRHLLFLLHSMPVSFFCTIAVWE